jgi:hypothetical protein
LSSRPEDREPRKDQRDHEGGNGPLAEVRFVHGRGRSPQSREQYVGNDESSDRVGEQPAERLSQRDPVVERHGQGHEGEVRQYVGECTEDDDHGRHDREGVEDVGPAVPGEDRRSGGNGQHELRSVEECLVQGYLATDFAHIEGAHPRHQHRHPRREKESHGQVDGKAHRYLGPERERDRQQLDGQQQRDPEDVGREGRRPSTAERQHRKECCGEGNYGPRVDPEPVHPSIVKRARAWER